MTNPPAPSKVTVVTAAVGAVVSIENTFVSDKGAMPEISVAAAKGNEFPDKSTTDPPSANETIESPRVVALSPTK